MKIIEGIGSCGYHLGESTKVRLCKLRTSSRAEWQYPIFLCKNCREHLNGFFKYIKE